jgi:hypothetical protein
MAGRNSTISVAILGDASKFKRALDDASGRLGRFGSSVGSVAGNVAKGFGVMSAAAGGLAVVGGKHLFDLGTELTSLDQKIGTVFSGESLRTVESWADDVAARMGLTSTQAQGLAANAGDLLKPMGFTADQAAAMSTEIIGLSGALSEWSGGQRSVEETAEILQKALLGERESLKSLGISINQAEVDTRALEVAQLDGRDAINAQDKALATQQLILEKSTDAQAAYADGGNKLIAAQNQLKARFGELKETLARRLLPVFNRMAGVVVELIEIFDRDGLAGVIRNLHRRFADAWPAIRRQLGVWARGFVNWVQEVGPPFLAALGEWLRDVASWFVDDALPVIVTKLGEWASAFVSWAGDVLPPFLTKMGETLRRFGDWFIDDGLPLIVSKLAQWAAAFVQWAVDIAPDVIAKLADFVVAVGSWMLGKVPTLAGYLLEWTGAFVKWASTDLLVDLIIALRNTLLDIGGRIVGWGSRMIDSAKDLGKDIIDAIVNGIKSAPGAIVNAIESLVPGGGLLRDAWSLVSRPVGLRAAGGPVTGGQPYIVGERGPELFMPHGSGSIVNNSRLGGMGGGTVNVTVNMPAGSNGDDVVRALQDYARRRGAIPVPVGTARY